MYDFEINASLGPVENAGTIRRYPEDFKVTEKLSFSPSGAGDHIYLYIEKRSCNTDWVAAQLAKIAELKSVDIGYAGKKDRHAVTRQWFSLHMPNQAEPDWNNLPEEIKILSNTRHEKKLKNGAIQANQFSLIIRDLTGNNEEIERRLIILKEQGLPNYFGSQRFGNNNANIRKLIDMVKNRRRVKKTQRGIYISAGRSYLFNQILKERIRQKKWNQAIDGDVMMLDGSRAIFSSNENDEQLEARIAAMDIHPSSILWGRGERQSRLQAAAIEDQVIADNQMLVEALDAVGSQLSHRALRVGVRSIKWAFTNETLVLEFELPSGSYATSLLNEVIEVSNADNS